MSKKTKCDGGQGYYPALFNRLFSNDVVDFLQTDDYPAVNVKENKKAYTLEILAPGFSKEDVDLWVDGDVLYISADEIDEVDTVLEDEDYIDTVIDQEFFLTTLSRSFILPKNVDTTKIKATGKNGVLTITLPKLENAPENTINYIEIQ